MMRKVLVVDDNEMNRMVLADILSDDYDVYLAENGKIALELINRMCDSLSAVMLDIFMPVMDGFELLKAVRANPNTSQLPIIVTTGDGESSTEIKALTLGANDFAVKPYNASIIKRRLWNVINLRENASAVNATRFDPLTGLNSRTAFFERAADLIAQHEPGYYVMSCLDVDGFKVINDQYGNPKGDEVLKHIADTLNAGFSHSGGICSRINADSFAVLYPLSITEQKRKDICVAVEHPKCLNLPIAFRIGRYVVEDLSLTPSAMYDRAALAGNSIKGRYDTYAKNYDESLRLGIIKNQKITSEMSNALATGQFEVWFQPQYNHVSGAIIGAEAIPRWNHPQEGFIPSEEYIEIFEKNGFIYELDKYVWRTVCSLMHEWIEAGRSPLPISMRVSRYDLLRDDFIESLTDIVDGFQLPTELVRLEISEFAFVRSSIVVNVVKRLVELGFTVGIYNFGQSESTLPALKDVPVQIINIDIRFLENDENSERGGNILESVVRMVKWLGLSVIASGVETLAQAEYLKSIGCYYVQGSLYSKSLSRAGYELLAKGVGKEKNLIVAQPVETLDNSAFWDPKSMDTLIFNSYVGGACIFEYSNGKTELLRINDNYARELLGKDVSISDAMSIKIDDYMDEQNMLKIARNIQAAIASGGQSTCEVRADDLPLRPGATYLRTTVRVISRAGERMLLYSMIYDITAQRNAEKKERDTAEQLQTIIKNINGGVIASSYLSNGAVKIVYANDTYYSMLGYTREQFENQTVRIEDVIHPGDLERARGIVSELLANQSTSSYTYRYIKRDGSILHVRCNSSVMSMDGIEELVLLSVITDMTQELETNRQILTLNENLTNMMTDMPGGFSRMKVDSDGTINVVFVNESFCNLLAMTRDEVMAMYADDVMAGVHPADIDKVNSAIAAAKAGDGRMNEQYRLLHKSGEYIWIQMFGRFTMAKDGSMYLNAYYSDLSAKESKELSIRKTMPLVLSAIMDTSVDLTFAKDNDFKYICCSPVFATFAGQESASDVIGKTDFELFPPSVAEKFRTDDIKLFEGGESLINYTESIPSTDGVPHYSSTSKYILRDSSGNIVGLYGIGRDITESKANDERLKLFVDSPPCAIVMFEFSKDSIRVLYASEGFYDYSGYTREEYLSMIDNDPLCMIYSQDKAGVYEAIEALRLYDTPMDQTFRSLKKDGGYRWFNMRGSVSERHGEVVIANTVQFDVTEQKNAEEAALIHEKELRLALSQMGRTICEYNIEAHTLVVPEDFAISHGIDTVMKNVPDCFDHVDAFTPDVIFDIKDFFSSIHRGEKTGVIEIPTTHLNGEKLWERMDFATIFDNTGVPVKALISIDDTTEQRILYELERNRPSLGESNMIVHALFNLTTGETLEYLDRDGNTVPVEEQTLFIGGVMSPENVIADENGFAEFLSIHNTKKLLERYQRGETEFSVDYRRRMSDGEIVWARNILRTMRKPGGNDVLLFEYCYNIEEEKQQELMYSTLVNENYDYVARINGKNKHFNIITNARTNYGLPPHNGDNVDEVIKNLTERCVVEEDRETTLNNLLVDGLKRNLADKEQFRFICREVGLDGSITYKKFTGYYLDREREVIVLTREDITQIMKEESEKSAMLADALNAANQASRAKTQFLSRMSHELRTPMNAIIGLAALSASEINNPKSIEDNIAKIGMSARYLLSLINDILEMSRIESGRMTLNESPFDFEKFVSNVNTIVYAQSASKGVDYDVIVNSYMEPTYVGDVTKLQEVLVNVLGNAVKFTSPGGKVTLAVEQIRCVNKRATLRFVINDTGVGIDGKYIPHLFEPFSQESTNLTSTSAGTGLGLAITKNLVEMMNGTITVQSIKNVGSVFTIDVQLGISEQSQQYLDMIASMNLSKLRALVVDDDVVVCKSTEEILKAMGMQAEWVDSGHRAVERVRELHSSQLDFDTIFIDWKMPDMNGIETTRQIRKIVGPDVTIIIITAFDWHTIENEAREAGVDMFMEKPLFQSSVAKAFEKIFLANKSKIETFPDEVPDFTGKHILLAEDNTLNAEIARRLLEKRGAQVYIVGNGLEAMEAFTLADEDFYDVILMDIRMPVMDGLTAAKNIRNLKKNGSRTIPIIAMTANAFDEDVELSLSSGMDAHMAKPIEPQVLYSTLRRFMKQKGNTK